MKMDYRRDLQHNYLVVETGEKTENYITRMMTENQVQGLLGCSAEEWIRKNCIIMILPQKYRLQKKAG